MKKIKVAVIDDHAVVRMGLKYAISVFKDMEVVGQHSDGEGAADFVVGCSPDVVLMDIRMPGKDGVSALEEILAKRPESKVIMLTTSGTEEDIYRSLTLGAKGYVMKDRDPKDIVDAIRTVAEGGKFVTSEVKERFEARQKAPVLTPRELEALTLLSDGLSNKEIAAKLGISEDGAKIHLKHAYEKLDVKDRVEAVSVALKRGIVRKNI